MTRFKLVLKFLGIVIAVYILFAFIQPSPDYSYKPVKLEEDFDTYYKKELAESRARGVKPGNEEKLIRYGKKTSIAFIYFHGYSASRAEGEYVVDRLARRYRANTYYVILPGHGADKEHHRKVKFDAYLQHAETALQMMPKLGDDVYIVATSMGGLISTYLAGKYNKIVKGVIMFSPFYEFANSTAQLLYLPGGNKLAQMIQGKTTKWNDKPDDIYDPAMKNHWITEKYVSALANIVALRRLFANEETWRKVKQPLLMMYYYKDEQNEDDVASVSAMVEAFKYMGQNSLSKAVPVVRGDHILASSLADTDKEIVMKETTAFINAVNRQLRSSQ